MAYGWNEAAGRFTDAQGRFVSVDMGPSFSLDNETDGSFAHSVKLADLSVLAGSPSESGSDFKNLCHCQFGVDDMRATTVSPFGEHVVDIVSICSQEEVIWPDAIRDIAVMKYPEPFCDGPDMHGVRQMVNADTAVTTSAQSDVPVPEVGVRARPEPAGVGLRDLLPESLCYGAAQVQTSTAGTAIGIPDSLDVDPAVGARLVTLPTHRTSLRCRPTDVSASRGHFAVSILPHPPGENHVQVG